MKVYIVVSIYPAAHFGTFNFAGHLSRITSTHVNTLKNEHAPICTDAHSGSRTRALECGHFCVIKLELGTNAGPFA